MWAFAYKGQSYEQNHKVSITRNNPVNHGHGCRFAFAGGVGCGGDAAMTILIAYLVGAMACYVLYSIQHETLRRELMPDSQQTLLAQLWSFLERTIAQWTAKKSEVSK